MKYFVVCLLICVAFLYSCNNNKFKMDFEIVYPKTEQVNVEDNYFGTVVKDPYRWLENDTAENTAAWVKSQNELTYKYLSHIPFRDQIKDRLTKIWDYPKMSAPIKKGEKFFLFKNDGLQNQSVLYYKNGIEGEDIELLDPNILAKDGSISLATTSVSDDGKYLGYSISKAGSDGEEVFIRDIETGKDLGDNLKWVKFSEIAWYQNGFYYSRYPEPTKGSEKSGVNSNCKIYYHEVGTKQEQDKLIYEDKANPEIGFSAGVTDSKEYLVISASQATSGNALYVQSLKTKNAPFQKIIETFDNDFYVVDQIGNKLFVYTNYNAPKYKLIEIDITKPNKQYWRDFIKEEEEGVLQNVSFIGGKIIANYMIDAHSIVKIFDANGKFVSNLDFKAILNFQLIFDNRKYMLFLQII